MEASSFLLFEEGKHSLVGVTFLPDSAENDEIVVTELHGVYIYNVSDQKSSKAWTARSSTQFSCPALQESFSKDKQFFVVEGNKTLWSWDHSALKMEERAIKKKFKKNIFTILENRLLKGNIVVIFEDGAVTICDKNCASLATNEEEVDQLSKKVEKATLFLSGESLLLFVIQNQRGVYSVAIYGILYDSEKDHWKIQLKFFHELPIPENMAKGKLSLRSSAFDGTARSLSLFWDDGTWEILEYHPHYISNDAHRIPRRKLSRKLNSFKLGEFGDISMASFHNSNIVLFGHSADSSDYLLTAWNDVYGTLQGTLEIKDVDPNHKILEVVVSKDANMAIAVLSGIVIVCPLYCPPASLANALGKMKTTNKMLDISEDKPLHCIANNLNAILYDIIPDGRLEKPVLGQEIDPNFRWGQKEENKKREALILKLIDKEATPTKEDFSVIWQELKETFHRGWEKEQFFNPYYTCKLVARCLEDESWLRVKAFLKRGNVSCRSLPQLFPTLIEKKQNKLLTKAMELLLDITPSDVLLLLKYFLSEQNVENFQQDFESARRKARAREQYLYPHISLFVLFDGKQRGFSIGLSLRTICIPQGESRNTAQPAQNYYASSSILQSVGMCHRNPSAVEEEKIQERFFGKLNSTRRERRLFDRAFQVLGHLQKLVPFNQARDVHIGSVLHLAHIGLLLPIFLNRQKNNHSCFIPLFFKWLWSFNITLFVIFLGGCQMFEQGQLSKISLSS